jgi:hypothetical protein
MHLTRAKLAFVSFSLEGEGQDEGIIQRESPSPFAQI